MRKMALILPITLVMSSVVLGQSLGDVARENRAKQKSKAASSVPKAKVITNEDLPASSDAEAGPREIEGKMTAVSAKTASGGPSAEEWKKQILAQKNTVANLQAQIDKVNDSVHFVVANEYYNGAQYNQYQAKKQENVAQMQQQLEEQKKHLAEMQEAARRAGMGSAVYEP